MTSLLDLFFVYNMKSDQAVHHVIETLRLRPLMSGYGRVVTLQGRPTLILHNWLISHNYKRNPQCIFSRFHADITCNGKAGISTNKD